MVYIITKNDDSRRIDRIIQKLCPELSMGFIFKCLRTGKIRLNKNKIQPSVKARTGDELSINIPDLPDKNSEKLPEIDRSAVKFIKPLILLENSHILALNKPKGLLVHGNQSLEEMVQNYLMPKIPSSLSFTPGPLHRLDRNTTGILFFSVSLEGAREFAHIFKNRLCEKYYLCLCDGIIETATTWEDNIERDSGSKLSFASENTAARKAITRVIPVFKGKKHTLALMRIYTGRTHQIRIQAALHNHPLTGDAKYRGSRQLPGYVLHAAAFKLKEPSEIAGFRQLTAPLPASAEATLKNVFNAAALKKAMQVLNRELHHFRGE